MNRRVLKAAVFGTLLISACKPKLGQCKRAKLEALADELDARELANTLACVQRVEVAFGG